MWQSSNPALRGRDELFERIYGDRSAARSETATLQGVVNKTALLVGITVLGGAGGYALASAMASAAWVCAVAATVVTIGVCMVLCGKPALAPVLAPVYAIVEGAFLGAVTGVLDQLLAGMQIAVPGGLALQAFVITIGVTVGMLALYSLRILKPTKLFVSVVYVATGGIMLTYLISFLMMLIGNVALPVVSITSALQGGWAGLAGIGVSVLFLGVASLWLIIDFKTVEDLVASGAPKSMEWYGGFALLVTLAWIYFEAVKLVFRIAVLLGNRD